jgi:hypothetical protein
MDGTYKLNAKGLPVLAFGFVDADQRFHLCAIAVCISEKEEDFRWCLEKLEDEMEVVSPVYKERRAARKITTMQDDAIAIRNGQGFLEALFLYIHMAMCWSHMLRAQNKAVEKHLVDKQRLEDWKTAVRCMHFIPHPFTAVFEYVAKVLFPAKWTLLGELAAMGYWVKEWTVRHMRWGRDLHSPTSQLNLSRFRE